MIKPMKLSTGSYRLLNPGSVVMVTVGNGEQDNLFAVTWNMPVRKDPPMAAILSGKGHYSYEFIRRTGEFGLNVPDASLAEAVYRVGTRSGADLGDKFQYAGLHRESPRVIKAPLVRESVGALECRVCQVVDLGASALVVAHILAAWADPKYFDGENWRFDQGLSLLHHLGDNAFCVSRDTLRIDLKNQKKRSET